ncbi:conserved hypothetical protein [Ricinus communis]|uniref:Uncharacterized protein n=1 Tax=Ricinus communis TaxID=3988 RepID=B9SKX5_RICCO|nr:conserved hypothetical protein [Ricinus communis]
MKREVHIYKRRLKTVRSKIRIKQRLPSFKSKGLCSSDLNDGARKRSLLFHQTSNNLNSHMLRNNKGRKINMWNHLVKPKLSTRQARQISHNQERSTGGALVKQREPPMTRRRLLVKS